MEGLARDDQAGAESAGAWSPWDQARKQIENAVTQARDIARKVRSGADFSALASAARSLHDSTFRIGVIGDFNNGKSTLINAMLGAELLPSGVHPMTTRLAEIRYGTTPKIIIEDFMGGRDEISHREFVERTERLKAMQDADMPISADVDYLKAVFESDGGNLRSGVAYVDVPGHQAGIHTHEAIADEAMKTCDALIAVLHADAALRTVESRRLAEALLEQGHRSVFVAVNKLGQLRHDQQEELVSGFAARWERFLNSIDLPDEFREVMRQRVYLIDSYNTLQSRLGRDDGKAGIPAFVRLEEDLATLMDGDLIAAKLARPRQILLRRLSELRRTVIDQNKLLDADLDVLDAQHATIDASIAKLQGQVNSIQLILDKEGFPAAGAKAVRGLATGFFAECLDRLPEWAEQGRERRAAPEGNKFTRLLLPQTVKRVERIGQELVHKLGRETARWSEHEVLPTITRQLNSAGRRVRPALEQFEHEVGKTWHDLLPGGALDPRDISIVDEALKQLLDLRPEELPLSLRPTGVVGLVMLDIGKRLLLILATLKRGETGKPDPEELIAAGVAILTEIAGGLKVLKPTIFGSEAEALRALDELQEDYACRVVRQAAVRHNDGGAWLADRYASTASKIITTRVSELLAYLRDLSDRIDGLYKNTMETLLGGQVKVAEERAILADADASLTSLIGVFENSR